MGHEHLLGRVWTSYGGCCGICFFHSIVTARRVFSRPFPPMCIALYKQIISSGFQASRPEPLCPTRLRTMIYIAISSFFRLLFRAYDLLCLAPLFSQYLASLDFSCRPILEPLRSRHSGRAVPLTLRNFEDFIEHNDNVMVYFVSSWKGW